MKRYLLRAPTPLGEVSLASDGEALTGLWFAGQRYDGGSLPGDFSRPDLPVFASALRWLGIYFDGREPDFTPPLAPAGTSFQLTVWKALLKIPYGETVSYGELAARCGIRSARAVGGAVGRNPVSLIVPCHRVVGADGSLTGYAGGIERKKALLDLERRGIRLN